MSVASATWFGVSRQETEINMQRWLFGIVAGICLPLGISASALAQVPAKKPKRLKELESLSAPTN